MFRERFSESLFVVLLEMFEALWEPKKMVPKKLFVHVCVSKNKVVLVPDGECPDKYLNQ